MLDYFLSFIKRYDLIGNNERILLSVSGGVDSMVMVDLFKQAHLPFAIAHVNFGLRGEDSELDEAFVREFSNRSGVDFYSKKASFEQFKKEGSTQMIAREFRYDYFRSLMDQQGFDKLAVAHHVDDSLETALYNFSKGTGLRGLTGIDSKNGVIIRPLLFAKKHDILSYAKENGIEWREDSSNQELAYQRNKIRNQVVPALETINPGIHNTFVSVSRRIRETQMLVNELVQKVVSKYLWETNEGVVIELGWLEDYKSNKPILYELLRSYGFSYAEVEQLHTSMTKGEVGKIFNSDDWQLNLDRRQLLLTRNHHDEFDDISLRMDGETVIDDRILKADIVEGNQLGDHHDPDIAYVDFELVSDLTIGRWVHGESFYPLGMKGKKKISDFMIDSKIPLTLKRDVLLIRSQGAVVWIAGHRIDDRFKVTPKTNKMLRLQLYRNA